MKIGDFVFVFPGGMTPHNCGLCRVRIFVHSDSIIVLLTDLGDMNPGPSVTNAVENVIEALRGQGLVAGEAKFIEHYEDESLDAARFAIVSIRQDGQPTWHQVSDQEVMALAGCREAELADPSLANLRLIEEIDRIRNAIDPFIDSRWLEEPTVIKRRFEIEANMISKEQLAKLVSAGADERRIQALLKSDLSIFGELYGNPQDEIHLLLGASGCRRVL